MRRLAQLVRHYWRVWHHRATVGLAGAWISAPVRRPDPVLRVHGGAGRPLGAPLGASLGAKVCVFCHFDPRPRVRGTVRRYVEQLADAGLGIVFVTNSGLLQAEDHAWATERCALVVERRNVGYDFGAWRDGMRCAELPAADTEVLVLANDSVYGPFHPVAGLLDRLDFGAADVWSTTESWQRHYHLQSYFLAFGRRALAHPAFIAFWNSVRDVRSKLYVVEHYEVGLTRTLLAGGLRCKALWPYSTLLARARELVGTRPHEDGPADPFTAVRHASLARSLQAASHRYPLNPTAELWQILLAEGFPFIKRELLTRNPGKVADVSNWVFHRDLIGAEEVTAIEEDLAGRGAHRYP